MKTNFTSFWLIIMSLLIISCTEDKSQPKINYDNDTQESQTNVSIFKDTTKTQIANLPISFDSTDVLLHVSGLISTEELNQEYKNRITSSFSKSADRYDETYFHTNEYTSNDYIRGWFSNIYFDDLATNKQQLLTQQPIFISDAYYLRKLGKNEGKHYILYSVYDRDSNKDGKIDQKDLLSKYISKLDGSDFKRITPEGHDFVKGVFVEKASRYYFITLEDINKDGYFDKGDKYHYYCADFSNNTYSGFNIVKEYNPLNSISE